MARAHMKSVLPKLPFVKTVALPRPSAKPLEFPNISRLFTETGVFAATWSYGKLFIVNFLCGFLLMAIGMQLFTLKHTLSELELARKARQIASYETIYWQTIVGKYQGYKDAYAKLASLEYQLGHTTKAQKYAQKVLAIDPGDEQGRQLRELIGEKH